MTLDREPATGLPSQEPLAITGIGCRFPGGADNPAAFWQLLCDGSDAIGEVPADRWLADAFYSPDPRKLGKLCTRRGGFLTHIDRFDPLFFGISPREAAAIDPQHRLLLELAWEALEDGGHVVEQLARSRTGVFIGLSTYDYGNIQAQPTEWRPANPYVLLGSTFSIAANRISYVFDFHGPSLVVDTACSSSLVAVHLACRSIWQGEADLALAGGANLMLHPGTSICFSNSGMLSPDGHCKSFDARANGYVRSEGGGIIVIKPLKQALRDNDRVYAVIRGTAVNQDGRTTGITVPSGAAQEAMLREACRQAGVRPAGLQYVEAHGTGTPVGDPVEANALGAVLKEGRVADSFCWIGSVKTNLGHLEAGAGITGVIKTALSLFHRHIPAHLHFVTPNPQIDFEQQRLRVPVQLQPWPANGVLPRLAGVNSFGFGGTNAHAILAECDPANTPADDRDGAATGNLPRLIPISAKSSDVLRAAARTLGEWLSSNPAASLPDVSYTMGVRRTHHSHRLALVSNSVGELVDLLTVFGKGEGHPGVTEGRVAADPRLVFVFTGMGPQWPGMGRQLLEREPVFRASVRECDEQFRPLAGCSLLDELSADEASSRLAEPAVAQPTLFALQLGLAALWRYWGIQPAAIVGHSVGEVAAAVVSGALTLGDGVRVIYHRSRLQQRLRGQGKMLAIAASVTEAERLIRETSVHDAVTVAAVNSPCSVTLSGPVNALETLVRSLEDEGTYSRFLQGDVPYHSAEMDSLQDALLRSLNDILPNSPQIPLYSTVTGAVVATATLDTDYWWRNLRQPVAFARAVTTLIEGGYDTFLEVGPHPVLSAAIDECGSAVHRPTQVLASLRRNEADRAALLSALGKLYTLGFPVTWERLCPPGRLFSLPAYPWQRERYWRESEESRQVRLGQVRSLCPGLLGPDEHPLLGRPLRSALATRVWHVDLDLAHDHGWLADHRVHGDIVYPAAATIETALAAARRSGNGPVCLDNVAFLRPLLLTPEKTHAVELVIAEDETTFEVLSRDADHSWTRLTTGVIDSAGASVAVEPLPFNEIQQRCPQVFERQQWYQQLLDAGYEYGQCFQGVERVWRADAEALASIQLSEPVVATLSDYLVHPALLDSCLQLYQAILPLAGANRLNTGTFVPQHAERIQWHRPLGGVASARPESSRFWCCFRARTGDESQRSLNDVYLCDESGQPVLTVIGLRSARIGGERDGSERLDDCFYEYRWLLKIRQRVEGTTTSVPVASTHASSVTSEGSWLLLADNLGASEHLADQLARRGERVIQASRGTSCVRHQRNHYEIRPDQPDDWHWLLRELRAEAGPCRGIVHLWDLDTPSPGEGQLPWPVDVYAPVSTSILYLVQSCTAVEWATPPPLYLVTRGAQPVLEGERPRLCSASTWGLGRVIRSEHPELRCTRIDLGSDLAAVEIRGLLDELLIPDIEDEIALRGGDRYVHRLVPVTAAEIQSQDKAGRRQSDQSFQLEVRTRGLLESLELRAAPRQPPAPGQVEIEVHAAALNFKDVAKALNLLNDDSLRDTWSGRRLGMECAGRIVACGESVKGLPIGAEVIALAPGSFASHVNVDAHFVVRKPAPLTYVEAVTLPVAFMTANYALHELAHVRRGDRVLIHAATGGVGLAAIELARRAGAEVFATAGSPEKRAFLTRLGIEHVMDSRSLDFAREVHQRTGGRGVDIVLNSLAGPAVARSLSILAPGGRFLELGKRGIEQNERLALRPFQNNLSFFAIDLDRIWAAQPEATRDALTTLVRQINDNKLPPLPHRVFPVSQVRDAFQWLARARHIGKVVLSFQDPCVRTSPAKEETICLRGDGTYLITGGLSGFGLATARWLVARGARNLVLVGRSGAASSEAQQAVRELEQTGTRVVVVRADVANVEPMREVLADLRHKLPPLRGLFHAAMVLDDAVVLRLDPERLQRVMRPKVEGAWNLHVLTAADPLDYFVLYSSTAAVFGNAGQGNYAAANVFLDSLAHYRRALGLPALSVNWSAVADVGVVARNDELRDHIEHLGFVPLRAHLLLHALGVLLERGAVQTTVMRFVGSHLGPHALAAISPRFSQIVGKLSASEMPAADKRSPQASLRERLQSATEPARREIISAALREAISKALGIPPLKIDADVPLTSMGLESLMAIDLNTRLKRELGVDVSVLKLLRGVTLNNLLSDIEQRLGQEATTLAGNTTTAPSSYPRSERWRSDMTRKAPRDFSLAVALGNHDPVDWKAEMTLPPDILGNHQPEPATSPVPGVGAILLTGASGFLGAFLLRDLLLQTNAQVHCLVRCSDAQSGKQRVRQTLETYHVWEETFADRFAVIPGDLAQPQFNCGSDLYRLLVEEVQHIYHCAARVNHQAPYEQLRADNVSGTRELLRLAGRGRRKAMHYVSTLGVFDLPPGDSLAVISETDPAMDPERLGTGYIQSKAVAEALVREAGSQGLAVTIYRPGLVNPCSQSGACTIKDFFPRLLACLLTLRQAPRLERSFSLTPVDHISQAIVRLSRQPRCAGAIYHLVSPHSISLQELCAMLGRIGHPLEMTTYDAWRTRLQAEIEANPDPALTSMLAFLGPAGGDGDIEAIPTWPPKNLQFDARATHAHVAAAGLTCPAVDERMLRACVTFLCGAGFLREPAIH
jgi:thioester reductase-like protein